MGGSIMKANVKIEFPKEFVDKVNKGCEELKKTLSDDKDGDRLKEIIEFNVDIVDHTTYKNLRDIIAMLYSDDVATTILVPMQNYGNPLFINEFEKIIKDQTITELIKKFYAFYGLKIKKAFDMGIHPEQWSNINTKYVKSADEPIALQHRIIKYDSSIVDFNSDVNSTIILINHLLKHLNNIENIEELKGMNYEELENMEEETKKIKKTLSIKIEG